MDVTPESPSREDGALFTHFVRSRGLNYPNFASGARSPFHSLRSLKRAELGVRETIFLNVEAQHLRLGGFARFEPSGFTQWNSNVLQIVT